jgi:hypothetical protein
MVAGNALRGLFPLLDLPLHQKVDGAIFLGTSANPDRPSGFGTHFDLPGLFAILSQRNKAVQGQGAFPAKGFFQKFYPAIKGDVPVRPRTDDFVKSSRCKARNLERV